ncbi:MAG: outer membrane protein assembly factor BamD [Bacteroidaceae bacterium]|nr:outer membrane protein assembly factor BamD [Bacteroidaceae bacterium]
MKKNIIIILLAAFAFSSCGEYNKVLQSTDYEYKYEVAKTYFSRGKYNKSASLLNDLITVFKGTDKAQESLYMLGMCYYNMKDYQTSAQTFITYYKAYPNGTYTELARYHAGKSYYLDTPEPRLDQSSTYLAMQELQAFLDYYPQSVMKPEAQKMLFNLQDKLVYKELLSCRLYYNLGNYMGNNYLSCSITAQNALKDYPYTKYREDLSILILRSKYEMADYSINTKKGERYRDAIDEYYSFKNEFPESKYLAEAEKIFEESKLKLKDLKNDNSEFSE